MVVVKDDETQAGMIVIKLCVETLRETLRETLQSPMPESPLRGPEEDFISKGPKQRSPQGPARRMVVSKRSETRLSLINPSYFPSEV